LFLFSTAAIALAIGWHFFGRPKLVCVTRDKPYARIILPYDPSEAQKDKGNRIAKLMADRNLNHAPPKAPPKQLEDAPTENSQVRYFFQANTDAATQLAKQLTPLLKKAPDLIDEEENRINGQFEACRGYLEFWLSSAE
jgi:hypothetical protein